MALSFFEEPLDNLDDESEETVSLCDLPIYGYDANYSVTDSENSMVGDESFEFFSEEVLKKVKDSHINENIIFCGNLVLPKQNTQEFKKHDHGSGRNTIKAMNKGRNHENATKKLLPDTVSNISATQSCKWLLSSGSKKSRWYSYGVGLAGIPAEMELKTIRSRQNRRRLNRLQGGCEEENGGFRHVKGLSRLIRELSCSGQTQANKMVKASLVYIPRIG